MESKFKEGDYIIHRNVGDMMVLKKIDEKGYMHFSYYYCTWDKAMIQRNGNNTMHMSYQKFLDFCTDEEKALMDKYIAEDKEKKKAKKNEQPTK